MGATISQVGKLKKKGLKVKEKKSEKKPRNGFYVNKMNYKQCY